jgi:hypothetical protein
MAITVGQDSYQDVAGADAYFTGRYGADAWLDADSAKKEALLKTATARIDRLRLLGTKADPAQPLQFPRAYSVWVEGEPAIVADAGILPNVARACCEEAFAMLKGEEPSERALLQAEGVRSVRIRNASETYTGAGASFAALASREAMDHLRPYVASGAGLG